MLIDRSVLSVIDNTGVKKVRIIKVLRNKRYASLGDKVLCSVTKRDHTSKFKKSDLVLVLITTIKYNTVSSEGAGVYSRSSMNTCILIDRLKGSVLGSKILYPVSLGCSNDRVKSLAPFVY